MPSDRQTRPRVSATTGKSATSEAARLVGTVLVDRYRVVRLLGHGANGAVCEVVDQTTQRSAALKLLVADDPDLAARLEREGKALGLLAHPHIVELVDSGRLPDGRPYVVTELVDGVSLRDEVETAVIEPRRALEIVRQLLEALHHAHAAGLIHRDVKPDNIMLGKTGWDAETVKLLDFGVAKVVDPNVIDEVKLTRAGLAVFGTPAYMAPETAIGEPIDPRTDLYSVGILLFELLTGRLPFDHDDPVTLMRMHVTDRAPLLAEAAPERTFAAELEQLVAHALDKVPDRRFPSAMAMHGAVQTVAQALAAMPPEPPTLIQPAPSPPASWVGAPALQNAAIVVPAPVMPTQRPVLVASPPAPGSPAGPSAWDRIGDFATRTIASARRHPARTAAILTGSFALIVVLVLVIGGGERDDAPGAQPGSSASREPARDVSAPPADAARAGEYLDSGNAAYRKKRFGPAVAAYERALAADRSLARDTKLRAAIAQIATRGDAANAIVALELLASKLEPPDTTTVVGIASTSKVMDVRHRAFAIAERDGFDKDIDRLASWSLDLWQGNCADRREAVARLVELGDARAVTQLQKIAKALPCVAKDALAAADKLAPAEPASEAN